MSHTPAASAETRVVRLALGQRARDVERTASGHVQFPDADVSAAILEDGPVNLVYGDPRHGFALPPGRFLRVNQAAGRVFSAEATPHLEALTPAAARALADSVAHVLASAGWSRVPDGGAGAAAVDAAARAASGGQGGGGVVAVGTWRVPRGGQPWAALPPGAHPSPDEWDGVQALVTVRPVRSVSAPDATRLILQVRLSDDPLELALFGLREARRERTGAPQTLTAWDREPSESVASP